MNNIRKVVFGLALLFPSLNNVMANGLTTAVDTEFNSWHQVRSEDGTCMATFPRKPDHMQQDMKMRGSEEKLRYDVYVADLQRKEVFMVLIAKYPGEVRKEDAKGNLEHFLNTLIAQNPNNRLIFAEVTEVAGNPAMDFFIRTDAVYFKGRAIQANNSLYLLAMECEIKNYHEHHFNHFINNFSLDK